MIILVLLVICALILFGGGYYAYRLAFYSPDNALGGEPPVSSDQYDPYRKKIREIREVLTAIPYETVTITSFDGLKLTGRYYHTADGAPLDICFHGYRSNPVIDFSGGSQLSFELGHNVLMIEQRAHCSSEGNTITFGILERRDLLSWVNYAVESFGADTQIILYGVSMGGATVLMGADLELPGNVKGIIADCPYSSPEKIIARVGKSMHFPSPVTIALSRAGARIYGGFRLNETSAAAAVKNTKVPILILHGDDDRFVPAEMSAEVQRANPEMVTRYTVSGAPHGIAYLVDTPFYHEKVKEFLNQVLA